MIRIIIACIVAFLLSFTLARSALAKGPKASAPKIHMCESVDLYSGPVDAATPSIRIAETCRDVSVKVATKTIATCTAEGPEVCEVLQSADRKTLLIEHKIRTTAPAPATVPAATIGGAA